MNGDWLAGIDVGADGAKALGEMLLVNTTLKTLDLEREEGK